VHQNPQTEVQGKPKGSHQEAASSEKEERQTCNNPYSKEKARQLHNEGAENRPVRVS